MQCCLLLVFGTDHLLNKEVIDVFLGRILRGRLKQYSVGPSDAPIWTKLIPS